MNYILHHTAYMGIMKIMKNCRPSVMAIAGFWVGGSSFDLFAADQVKTVETPPVSSVNSYYAANRAPLASSPFVKLPIGSITPRGWLRHQRHGLSSRSKAWETTLSPNSPRTPPPAR
jgi:hypothetical protein